MSLTLEAYRTEYLPLLFTFWRTLGAEIPYFFPVSQERWQACLLADRLDGALMFKSLETYLAVEAGRLLGFIQFGQPNFAWNERGEKYYEPAIGVIRHLYFEREFPQAGQALLAQAERFLERFPKNHAFFHILGMSCNAHHGKLHESQFHVEALLLENGFQVEHKNVYFVLDLEHPVMAGQMGDALSRPRWEAELEVTRTSNLAGLERYEARLEGTPIGSAEIRILEPGTGDLPGFAYLTWIGLAEGQPGRGLGTIFLRAITKRIKARGYRYLHTDTASTNLAAQHFYVKFGFCNQGKTHGYLRLTTNT